MIEQTRYTDDRIVKWLESCERAETAVEFGAGICNYTGHIRAKKRIAVDLSPSNLDRCPWMGVERVVGDMRDWDKLGLDEFDCAVFLDSLEHVDMKDGVRLVCDLKQSGHVQQILAFVPMGHHPQEDHLSTWEPSDLRELGFDVVESPDFHASRTTSRGAMYGRWRG